MLHDRIMLLVAIGACEIGFWVLLAAGLFVRYVPKWRRTSTVLLIAVPLVDAALLVFTIIDLRRGTPPNAGHSLAAVYIGFSVAFGHDLIRWADRRVAHRFAGGPPPPPKLAGGTPERARKEWRDWSLALLGYAVAAGLVLLMAALAGPHADTTPLFSVLPGLGGPLAIWLVGWPITESIRAGFASKGARR